MNSLPLQFLILAIAGWVNRSQQDAIEYLREENRGLREHLGDRLCRAKTSSALPRWNLPSPQDTRWRLAMRPPCAAISPAMTLITSLAAMVRALLRPRFDLALENMALRQQLAVLKTKGPRPRLRASDRVLWVLLQRLWPRWREALIIVKPETVIRWHRQGLRRYWRWKSRTEQGGRPAIDGEVPDLVRRMATENPTWGAPRIHGELRMLGFNVSERTAARYVPKRPRNPNAHQRWMTFLRNHRACLAAMDFFTVPTLRFEVLYVLFIIHHARRTILHVGVSSNPTAGWICQRLREALPDDQAPEYLIFDRDGKFGHEVIRTIKGMGTKTVRTAYRSPWQNGVAERWVLSVRHELLDHVIVLGERHLRRMLYEYVEYYHEDRCHLGLEKDCPVSRQPTTRSAQAAKVVSLPRVGGLHNRYEWRAAA